MDVLGVNLNEARLLELCAQECPESQTLEFKRELPGIKTEKDKVEFLKDVCALANSDGGDLVYGVDEADGKARGVAPISTEPADAAMRRLSQIMDAGIEPRIVGYRLSEVPVTGGYVLRLTMPASFTGPHRYGPGRFVMRVGTLTRDFSYGELRSAFDRTATLAERARRFRAERLTLIAERRTWRPIIAGPVCVLHLIPISSMATNRGVDIAHLNSNYHHLVPSEWRGATRSTNLDGLIAYPGWANDKEMMAYVQVFRSGALEAVRFGSARTNPERKIIPPRKIAEFYRDAIASLLAALRSFGHSGPAVIGASMLTISGYTFGEHASAGDGSPDLVLPETWLDDVDSVKDVDEVARPLLDVLWQAFDIEACVEYLPHGKWSAAKW